MAILNDCGFGFYLAGFAAALTSRQFSVAFAPAVTDGVTVYGVLLMATPQSF